MSSLTHDTTPEGHTAPNFIEEHIRVEAQTKPIATRFPPEPNGYLHIGHAKSICLNFGIARTFGGSCNLRFDDTNPEKESAEFIVAIKEDICWLGFSWDAECYASDYFEQLYLWAEHLIQQGLAYVDESSPEQMRLQRGTLTTAGNNSLYRDRPIAESLDLLRKMKEGQCAEGSMVLRAKIDMAHPNITMRDPTLYRIRTSEHPRTGNKWHIYPSYDFAHGQSDAIEGITHSLCTLEFEEHRPLYEWLLENLPVPSHPQQIEFSRLQLEQLPTSKRKLSQLVADGVVEGWDDPRMPTIRGMRRRGYPAAALRDFCQRIGVTKKPHTIELSLLEHCVRQHLEQTAVRAMAVRNPIKITISNWDKDTPLQLDIPWHPTHDITLDGASTRSVAFGRTLWIDGDDFMLDPPPKYHRLRPQGAVRLKYGFIIDCLEVVTNAQGAVVELICSYDPATRSGQDHSGRKVRGAIQWAPENAIQITARNYQPLYTDNAMQTLNQHSCINETLLGEPAIASMPHGQHLQLERLGFYALDPSTDADNIILNRSVPLRDSWGKKHPKK